MLKDFENAKNNWFKNKTTERNNFLNILENK